MLDFALGELGLTAEQFYSMSWYEYGLYSQGYIVRHARYLDGVRRQAYYTLIAAGAKINNPARLFRIATDPVLPQRQREELTPEALEAIKKRYFNK